MAMRSFWPLLTGLLLWASPAESAASSMLGETAELQRYRALEPAAQKEWAEKLLSRLQRASQLVLQPEDWTREHTLIEAFRQRVSDGPGLSEGEIARLLRTTDEREKEAIERAARKFRVQVYQTFRQQRGIFSRRREAWNRVRASWEGVGGPFDQQDRLLDWLQLALHSSLPDSVGPLPADPKFERAAEPLQALVQTEPPATFQTPLSPAGQTSIPLPKRTESIGEGRDLQTRDGVLRQPADSAGPIAAARAVVAAAATSRLAGREQVAGRTAVARPARGLGAQLAEARPASPAMPESPLPSKTPSVLLPERSASKSAELVQPGGAAQAPPAPGPATVSARPRRVADPTSDGGTVLADRSPAPETPRPTEPKHPPSVSPPPRSVAVAAQAPSAVPGASLPMNRLSGSSLGADSSPVLRQPADDRLIDRKEPAVATADRMPRQAHSVKTATAESGQRQSQLVASRLPPDSVLPMATVADADLAASLHSASAQAAPRFSPAVEVNVDELAALVAGANFELKALEAELADKPPWTAQRLQPLVQRLQVSVRRSGALGNIRSMVSQELQARVESIESPAATIAILSERVSEARNRALSDDFGGGKSDREEELLRLDELSRQLAELLSQP